MGADVMSPERDFSALLSPLREAAQALPREALPALCGALAALQAELLLPTAAPAASDLEDRALTPAQAAKRIGRSADWVYRHRHDLPITRLSSGRWVISESKLRRWIETRTR
jgi:hypothetical protein